MDDTSAAPRAGAIGRAAVAYAVLGLAFWRAVADYFARDIGVGGATYRVGDWLINYAGGFVRRGLFGELLFAASPPGQPTLWALAGFQLACYAIVAAYVVGFLHRTRYAWPAVALACSPAALPFIGWDVEGGWRKEIIGFAAIALLGWARRRSGERLSRVLVAVAVVVFGLAIFSWEASVFAIPMLLFLLRHYDGRPDLRSWATWSILGLGLVGGVASLLFRGDTAVAAQICRTVVAQGLNPDLCGGAIAKIGQPLAEAMAAVAIRFPLYQWFLVLLPLALLPVLTSPWLRRNWPWFLATIVTVVPLYVIAEDYGRWAHLLLMAPALAIMAGDLRDVATRWWNGWTTVAYVTLWGLPHWLFPDGAWPLHSFWGALLETVFNPR
ncbi:MAG: hypothetical protein LCH76_05350 [Actinobacteria bacterium]|nr:hypothetical protein [Actinomycetota bacterium]